MIRTVVEFEDLNSNKNDLQLSIDELFRKWRKFDGLVTKEITNRPRFLEPWFKHRSKI